MKTVIIEVQWRTTHKFEVADDWQVSSTLDGFSKEQLEEMSPSDPSCELYDWELICTR